MTRKTAAHILAECSEYSSPEFDPEEVGRTMGVHNLSDEAWDSLSYDTQAALIDALHGAE